MTKPGFVRIQVFYFNNRPVLYQSTVFQYVVFLFGAVWVLLAVACVFLKSKQSTNTAKTYLLSTAIARLRHARAASAQSLFSNLAFNQVHRD